MGLWMPATSLSHLAALCMQTPVSGKLSKADLFAFSLSAHAHLPLSYAYRSETLVQGCFCCCKLCSQTAISSLMAPTFCCHSHLAMLPLHACCSIASIKLLQMLLLCTWLQLTTARSDAIGSRTLHTLEQSTHTQVPELKVGIMSPHRSPRAARARYKCPPNAGRNRVSRASPARAGSGTSPGSRTEHTAHTCTFFRLVSEAAGCGLHAALVHGLQLPRGFV